VEGYCAKLARGLAAVAAFAFIFVGAAFAESGVDLLPEIRATFSATPAPIPVPSEGRIPVSLRLADTISTDDGRHPPAATEVRFDLDRQLHFDMAEVPTCKPTARVPRDQSLCDEGMVASGRIQMEVEFPEQMPIRVLGDATIYKTGPRAMTIVAYLPAPVTGRLLIPITVQEATGNYGLRATAAISKVAGGSGSLTYLGLRFRKGLFSAACPKGRLQSRVTDSFADGTLAAGGAIVTC
jgi:hypothetical protein